MFHHYVSHGFGVCALLFTREGRISQANDNYYLSKNWAQESR